MKSLEKYATKEQANERVRELEKSGAIFKCFTVEHLTNASYVHEHITSGSNEYDIYFEYKR